MPFLATPRVLNSVVNEQTGQHRVALQITDLFPHKTQSSAVYTPNFQGPLYLYAHGRDVTEAVATGIDAGNLVLDAQYQGLAAYLLATVEAANGAIIGAAAATSIANALVLRLNQGLSLTLSDINSAIDAESAGATLTGGDSFGTVLQVLQIISGYQVFTLAQGVIVQLAADFNSGNLPAIVGNAFSAPADASKLFNKFNLDSFYLSARRGQLKKAQTRKDKDGNPIPFVVCYADDGTLIQ
tara:strand:+ start:620 stop:1342 length:723 start_codon:yes stop_codon:yes gene_type:complete